MNEQKTENSTQAVTKGRPKGSVDSRPRKKRSDRELVVNPGDNTAITMFNVDLMQLPTIDTGDRKQVEERIMWYFQYCIDHDIKPGVAGLCLALGITRQAWALWGTGTYRDYQDLVAKTRTVMESIMEQYMLQGKINPVTAIFLCKNHFGYADKSEVVLTPNNPLGEQKDAESLRQKYLESTYGVMDGDYSADEE